MGNKYKFWILVCFSSTKGVFKGYCKFYYLMTESNVLNYSSSYILYLTGVAIRLLFTKKFQKMILSNFSNLKTLERWNVPKRVFYFQEKKQLTFDFVFIGIFHNWAIFIIFLRAGRQKFQDNQEKPSSRAFNFSRDPSL